MGKIVNRTELAQELGISFATVDEWLRQGAPVNKRPGRHGSGTYEIDLAAVVSWRIDREHENTLGNTKKLDIDEAKRRKVAAEAALAEHELAKEQGAAISIDDSFRVMAAHRDIVRRKLLAIPAKLSLVLATENNPNQCKKLLQDEINEALEALQGTELPDEFGGDADLTGDMADGENTNGQNANGQSTDTIDITDTATTVYYNPASLETDNEMLGKPDAGMDTAANAHRQPVGRRKQAVKPRGKRRSRKVEHSNC